MALVMGSLAVQFEVRQATMPPEPFPEPEAAPLVGVVLLGAGQCGVDFGGGVLLSERNLFLDDIEQRELIDRQQRRICERLFSHLTRERSRMLKLKRPKKSGGK